MEIGTDCTDIIRFENIYKQKRLLKKIFTNAEIKCCQERNNSAKNYATRFAAKEAIIKALFAYDIKIPFNRIEITNEANGRPIAKILGEEHKFLNIKISTSHAKDIATALAIVEKKEK